MRRSNPFRGRWRIVSTDVWEARDLDDLGPAQITFGPGQAGEPRLRERIDVDPLDAVARRLHDRLVGRAEVASRETVRQIVYEAARGGDPTVSPVFLLSEWADVVDAWQLDSWDSYRDVARLGRKTRLPEKQRRAFWAIFERIRAALRERRLVTTAELYGPAVRAARRASR